MRIRNNLSRVVFVTAFLFTLTMLLTLSGIAGPAGLSANAGPPQLVAVGATVRLDASLSTNSSGSPLSYQWTLVSAPAGSNASFSNAAAVDPTFIADQAGTYVAQVAITDGVNSSTSQVTISTLDTPPVANAGKNQVVQVGKVVHLDGSGSNAPDGNIASFQWTLLSAPATSKASIANPTAVSPTIFVDAAGTYVAQLTVTDSHGASSTSKVTISTQQLPPIADAGKLQTVTPGTTVQLDASASSDPNGDPLTFSWSLLSKPAGSSASLSAASSVNPTFVADTAGTYVAQVTVTDSSSNSSLATVEVTTNPVAPVANAGAAQNVAPGATVQLDGSRSASPNNGPLQYIWTLLSKPAGSTAAITSGGGSSATFTADLAGQYLAQLQVSDGFFTSTPSTVLITAASAGANLVISPSPVNFGNQTVSTTSAPIGVTLTNLGTSSAQVSTFLLSGNNPSDFSISGLTGVTIAPNSAIIFNVTFVPLATGARSASLSILDNTSGSPHNVTLQGTGAVPAPIFQTNPTSLTFSSQALGHTSTLQALTISNTGTASLIISSLSVSGANAGDFAYQVIGGTNITFGRFGTFPVTIAPGGTMSVNVSFTPTQNGARAATLVSSDNAGGNPHSISLSGTGGTATAPGFSASPNPLTFQGQQVGTTSAAQSITISNPGSAQLQITALALSGGNAGDFAFAPGFNPAQTINVAAAGNTSVPIVFTPTVAGARTTSLLVTDNATGSPHSVTINGSATSAEQGPAATLSTTSINFQSQTVNVASSPMTVTVTNTGTGALNITSFSITGPNAGDFQVQTAPTSLAANASLNVSVVFTPSAIGTRMATLQINDNATNTPQAVSLTGVGASPNGPTFSPTPSSFTFANQALLKTSSPQPLSISNPGTTSLIISSLTVAGTNAGDFSYQVTGGTGVTFGRFGTYPVTIAPGGTLTGSVFFTPTQNGARTATLVSSDNAAGSPHSITLSGTGGSGSAPGFSAAPTPLTFASQQVGTTSSSQAITISNPGTAQLQITALSLNGGNAGDFAFASGFNPLQPINIAANASTSIPLVFAPTASGARSTTLTITDNATGSPHSVTINGTATSGSSGPVASLSTTTITFPSQPVNVASSPMTVTVTNTGTSPLNITSFSLIGANAGDFSVLTAPTSLAANASLNVSVVFTPSATGTRAATLQINNNATNSPQSVSLTGVGASPSGPVFNSDPSSVTFAPQPLGHTSSAQPLNISNPGNAALIISSLTVGGANSSEFSYQVTGGTGITFGRFGTFPLTIAAGGTLTGSVFFTPTQNGTRTATLVSSDNAAGNPHSIALSGTGGSGATFSATPNPLTFASQQVGTTSAAQSITISNTGQAQLQITALSLSGGNAGDFNFAPGFNPLQTINIAGNASATIPIVFAPTAAGARSTTLTIADNAAGSPHSVTINGTASPGPQPAVSLSATSIAFPNQQTSVASAPMTITLTNTGTAPLSVSSFTFSGVNPTDFSTTTAPAPSIPVNGTLIISVVFTPSLSGFRSATLLINDNAPGTPHSITLSGTGINVPQFSASATNLSFGNQQVGQSISQPLTISNPGSDSLMINSLSVSGTNAGDFSYQATGGTNVTFGRFSTFPATIGPGGTMTGTVSFRPAQAGPRSATLVSSDNASGSPHSIALSGTGTSPAVSLSASTINFGSQVLNNATGAMSFTITNSGQATLQITSMPLGGSNAGDFTYAAPFVPPSLAAPIAITPNNSITVGVIFTPRAVGARSATITLGDNAPDSPQTLTLSGTGTQPIASLSTSTLPFADQVVGQASPAQIVTLSNPGTAPLVVTSISITGGNAGDFATSAIPTTVPVNGSLQISVVFKPSALGPRSTTLQIVDNASPSTQNVTLSGNGIGQPGISVIPSPMAFPATTNFQKSAAIPLTINNTGQGTLTINNISFSGDNAGDFSFTAANGINSFPQFISPGSSLVYNVFFTPSQVGPRTGVMLISENVPGIPLTTVSLSGTGIATPATDDLNTVQVNFASQPINTTSATQMVTITNHGQTDLNVTSVALTTGNTGDFSISPTGPFTVSRNGGTVGVNVTFTPTNVGSRTATMKITSDAADSPKTVTLSGVGFSLGQLTLLPLSVGTNLEALAVGSLDTPPSTPLTVTITSNDPNRILLSPVLLDPTGLAQGSAQITGTVAAGQGRLGFGFPAFWVQSLGVLGTSQITMTAPGYFPASANVTVTPSGFVLSGPLGAGANFTSLLGGTSTLTVSPVQLDNAGNIISSTEPVRGGLSVNVTVNSATTSVGTIANNPAVVQGGKTVSGPVTFQPNTEGATLLSVTQPAGFMPPPTSSTQLTASVTSPVITLNAVTIGYNQEVRGVGSLNLAPTSPLQVTITSSDANKILLSTDPAAQGVNSITVTVPANQLALPPFYLQSLASSGGVQLTASAPGYTNATGNVLLNGSAFLLNGPNGLGGDFSTSIISQPTELPIELWQLDSASRPFIQAPLRPGITVPVSVTSSNTSAGALSATSVQFITGTASNSDLTFQPSSNCNVPCTTTVGVTQPAGFSAPVRGGQLNVTVTLPSVSPRTTQTIIGRNLEVLGSGALDAASTNSLTVTISSDNANVLLSNSPTVRGSQSITLVVNPGAGVNGIQFPTYYIQAIGDTGTATLTASAPGFNSGSIVVSMSPSGFLINGSSGLGIDFSAPLAGHTSTVSVSAVLLDPDTLAPTETVQKVIGGSSPSVSVSSDSGAVSVPSSVTVPGGSDSAPITLQLQSKGAAHLTVGTPNGYTTPSSGNPVTVTVF